MTRQSRTHSAADLGLPDRLDDDRPRGDQIRGLLEGLAHRLGPGASLPSDRQLADHLGVARMTVRAEIKRLTIDGVLEVEHGRGTFVALRPRLAPEWGTSYTLAARAARGEPGSSLLENDVTSADARIARLLAIPEGAPILSLARLRSLDGRPVGIERVALPLSRFPGLERIDLESRSLYEVLAEGWGLVRASSSGAAAATLPGEADAALLGVSVQDPCLLVQMTSSDADGVPFEMGRSLYRADRYEIGIDLIHDPMPSEEDDDA